MGDKEAKNEFNELFDDLIVDVCESTAKYSDIVKQLEALLELEKETLVIKRKVSTFSLDYDDDLVIVHTIKSVDNDKEYEISASAFFCGCPESNVLFLI